MVQSSNVETKTWKPPRRSVHALAPVAALPPASHAWNSAPGHAPAATTARAAACILRPAVARDRDLASRAAGSRAHAHTLTLVLHALVLLVLALVRPAPAPALALRVAGARTARLPASGLARARALGAVRVLTRLPVIERPLVGLALARALRLSPTDIADLWPVNATRDMIGDAAVG